MSERPENRRLGGQTPLNINCFRCDSPSTVLVEAKTPLLAGDRIYRCLTCGNVDWVEDRPGTRSWQELEAPIFGLQLPIHRRRTADRRALQKVEWCSLELRRLLHFLISDRPYGRVLDWLALAALIVVLWTAVYLGYGA